MKNKSKSKGVNGGGVGHSSRKPPGAIESLVLDTNFNVCKRKDAHVEHREVYKYRIRSFREGMKVKLLSTVLDVNMI